MNALVVQAHPSPDSFNEAVLAAVVEGLTSAGHVANTIRLYQEDFEPAMSLDERLAYKTDQPVLDSQVARYVELLNKADALIFVYPTWFFGMPATLKGWLDRVMLPGVAFVFDETGRVRPGLDHISRLIGVSTYGASWAGTKMVTDSGRRTVKRTLRMVCSRRVRTAWLALYRFEETTADDRARFLDRVRERMAAL